MLGLDPPFDHIVPERAGSFAWPTVFSSRTDFGEGASTRASVAVIGGGLAGLVAAYELGRRGASVSLYERDVRLGGRIHTHFFSDGSYGELGAMRIPAAHTAVMDYVTEFELPTRPFVNWNPGGRYQFGRAAGTIGCPDLATAEMQYRDLKREFPGLKRVTPELIAAGPQSMLVELLVKPLQDVLEDDAMRWGLFRSHEASPRLRDLRRQRLPDYATGPAVGMSDDDWRFASRVTGVAPFQRCSVAQFVMDMLPAVGAPMVEIIGGMSRLPDAFARRIRQHQDRIIHGCVTAVSVNDTTVDVTATCDSDSVSFTETFDAAVVTATPGACGKIDFAAEDPTLVRLLDAMRNTEMGPLAKTVIAFSERFWEQEPLGIFGGLSSSSGPALQCWYPNDNSRPTRNTSGRVRYVARDSLAALTAGVITASYRWADGAEVFAGMSDEARLAEALLHVGAVHDIEPGRLTALVTAVQHKSWPEGLTVLNSLEALERQTIMNSPVKNASGNPALLFAGEHTSSTHGWMISAVQAALGAVRRLIAQG